MNRAAQLAEIDRNYDVFQRNLKRYMPVRAGKYALMKGGNMIGFFNTVRDTAEQATLRFHNDVYSIQQVVEDPVDLGFFSRAGS